VKNSKTLNFEEKVRYMSLLKEKINFAANEELDDSGVEELNQAWADELEAEDDPGV
jgi:hypothetical protein